MALTLLSHEVSDLCIGKPPLQYLSVDTTTVADAIVALKSSDEPFLSVWTCNHNEEIDDSVKCECLGKICMADVIVYLSNLENNKLLSLSSALDASVSVLLPKSRSLVVHVQSSCSLIEAIDLIIRGAQNLIVPIQSTSITKRRQQHKLLNRNAVVSLNTTTATTHKNNLQFCWITQEDIIRFLLDSISVFSPLPSLSITDLGVINSTHTILTVDYYSSASSAVSAISNAIINNVSVAVVDNSGCDLEDPHMALIGEISPMTLACCDETAVAAVDTLSAGDLMSYIDGSGPPESLIGIVRNRLEDKGMVGLISLIDSLSSLSGSSSDEETSATRTRTTNSYGRSVSNAARMSRKSVAIVCNKKSSLMAVMIQAIAHKNNLQFCWITQEDIIRFLLDSISVFSPLPSLSISDLGVINSTHTILTVDYYSSASSAVSAISNAIIDNVSVAVVDNSGCDLEDPHMALIGEISPMTLACCDETAVAAVATLSAGDLMSYIDGSGPPESLIGVVRNRLEDKGMVGLISLIDSLSSLSGSSSDEETPATRTRTTNSYGRSVSNAARMSRKSVAIVCNKKSSLMAVMIQAIAHRVSYVWVIDEDGCLIGMVTFVDILKLFREFLDGMN